MSRFSARLLVSLPCVAAALLLTSIAQANTINAVAYCNISAADAASTPVPGATPSGTECATFTASSIDFFNGNGNTLGSFLNYYGVILGSVNYLNGFTADSDLDDSFFQFTGSAHFVQGQTYNATQDDGTVMTVDGNTVVNAPAPTAPVDTQFVFNEATGNYDFVYDYTEQMGGSTYNTDATLDPVPEPASLLLLATGGALALFYARRRNLRTTL